MSDTVREPERRSWRDSMLSAISPRLLGGISFGAWLRMLRDNRFDLDAAHLPRAVSITLGSLLNSVGRRVEDHYFREAVERTTIAPPLFVLGIWRSGTTHLHNLLARDDRFGYPNLYQTIYAHSFLTTERFGADMLASLLPPQRPQDNMALGVGEPQEDELALVSLTGRSMMSSLFFPRNLKFYARYVTLRELSPAELAEWKAALLWFVRKVSLRCQRPLVLKSPAHTARIRVLLDMFPDARFVHIQRDPFAVFQSMRAALKLGSILALHEVEGFDIDEHLIAQYKEVYDAYFEERALIPPGRLHEVRYEDVEADPLGQLRATYEALALPDFGHAEPALRAYVESLRGYHKNTFEDLPAPLARRLAVEWRQCFDAWGYPARA